MNDIRHDPQWKTFAGRSDSSMTGLGRLTEPTIGIGAYVCNGCAQPHVVIAALIHDIETDILVSPQQAREMAAALLEQANRVDAGGVN